MRLGDFLKTVITTDSGNFCLATRDDKWHEHWYSWPNDFSTIVEHAEHASTTSNVYFSSHLFSQKSSLKSLALPSKTIQADLDHAQVATLAVMPSVLVQTSPGRHQGYWITDKLHTPDKLEEAARRIAYGVIDCDRSGWPAGHKVRLPDTYNYKYPTPYKIQVAGVSLRELTINTMELFPELKLAIANILEDSAWLDEDDPEFDVPATDLLLALKGHIKSNIVSQFAKPAKDRSAALWALMCETFRAGCSRDQVFYLAVNSANNKFSDRKYNASRDLKKDILRAEKHVDNRIVDIKAMIADIRRNTSVDEMASERKLKIANAAINYMRENGEFIHCKGGTLWYLRKDTGAPISVSMHSEWLNAYTSTVLGLNATETEQRFLIQEMVAFAKGLAISPDLQMLSFYDHRRNVLMLHTGARDVLHIGKDSIDIHSNGYGSMIFQCNVIFEMFSIDAKPVDKWWEYLFDGCLHNVISLTREEVLIVLRAWFLFLLFKNMATTRPLLALFGQQGSGKTTSAKIFYRLLYGRYRNISSVSSAEDFSISCSSFPFLCFDGLDEYVGWLPNQLSLCAGDSDIERRALYTNSDVVYFKRQAMVAITAHNPRFNREDIIDRLLLINFKRLEEFGSESLILERVSSTRNELWAGIVKDIQLVLNTEQPSSEDIPQFRIEDFSRLGAWFSKAIGETELFKQAISKIRGGQKSFNLDEDRLLVESLTKLINARKGEPGFEPTTALWHKLLSCTKSPEAFIKQYRNPLHLDKKLWVMQDSLKSMFAVEWERSTSTGRTWKFVVKEEVSGRA